jgi:hypothetical protein
MFSTPGDATSARSVMIEAAVIANPSKGTIEVTKIGAFYRDDNTPFTQPLADQLIITVQGIIDTTLVQLYSAASPDIPRFYVQEVLVASNGITVRTVSLP